MGIRRSIVFGVTGAVILAALTGAPVVIDAVLAGSDVDVEAGIEVEPSDGAATLLDSAASLEPSGVSAAADTTALDSDDADADAATSVSPDTLVAATVHAGGATGPEEASDVTPASDELRTRIELSADGEVAVRLVFVDYPDIALP